MPWRAVGKTGRGIRLGHRYTRKATGASSLAVTYTAGWGGLSLRQRPAINTAGYSSIRFAVYGRAGSGRLSLYTQSTDGGAGQPKFQFTPTPNVWSQIDVPLSALGNPTQIARINIMDWTGAVSRPTTWTPCV